MSTSRTSTRRIIGDHFEPDEAMDPKAQRQLRGQLEQIDYTAYNANRQVVSAALAGLDAKKFERLALATASARARWVATGVAAAEAGLALTPQQVSEIAGLRSAYEELSEVYEAMRRMIERGYLEYKVS
jgi:long-subunit acyl-CoA synthetase (AMP-forming)